MAEFRNLTEKDHAEAVRRGRRVYVAPRAVSAHFDRRAGHIVVLLDTGIEFKFDPNREPVLARATPGQLEDIIVEGVGSTLRFPALDADLTVSSLPDYPGGTRRPVG